MHGFFPAVLLDDLGFVFQELLPSGVHIDPSPVLTGKPDESGVVLGLADHQLVIERLEVVVGDALKAEGTYDAILLDAPCSATGTMRASAQSVM